MELVYLWVEEYKNIHKQGFNFSPRFECNYNEEENELTIEENDDYIENFFGENINVTAIVGKNGSGKSSILKLILMLIYYQKFINLDRGDKFIDPKNFDRINYKHKRRIERMFQNKKIFLILYNNGEFEKISIYSKFKFNKKINYFNDIYFFTLHYNYMLDTLYDGYDDSWVKEIYHKADSYELPLLLEPYKNNNDKQIIDIELIEYLNNQNMLRFYSKLKREEDNIIKFFKPNKININMKKVISQFMFTIEIDSYEEEKTNNSLDRYGIGKEIKFLIYKYFKLQQKLNNSLSDKNILIANKIEDLYQKKSYKELNKIYIALKVLDSKKSLFSNDIYKKIEKWFSNIDRKIEIDFEFRNLLRDNCPVYEIRKIKLCLDFEDMKIYDKDEFKNCIDSKNKISVIKNILRFIPPWIEVEWFQDTKSIKSLSSGEKTFLTFIINLIHQIQNINDRDEYTTINLFLDESELGFHPQWQKKYLIKIIEAIKQVNKKKINLLFATHSSFILSDIPKQNIIFLDTYKKEDEEFKNGKQEIGNCKVLTHDEVLNKKQTFGANIHTLLSDSFFMEDGLMGEFAKGKINEIKRFYDVFTKYQDNKKIKKAYKWIYLKKRKKFWQIQKIIGEAFLQTVIKNYLDEIENILFEDKAKKIAIERFIKEFGEEAINEVMNNAKN